MGFFARFILKYGPGSPGQTARVMCSRFKGISAIKYDLNWRTYLLQLARIRHEACLSNPLGYRDEQTYLNAVTEERWEQLIEQTNGSLAVFIFILMYFETKAFRKAVSQNKWLSQEDLKENREAILKIIYDVVNKRSYNNNLSFQDSLKLLNGLGGYYNFSISTRLSKAV
jgi:hypothetical protein